MTGKRPRLAARRKAAGYSQEQLAERLGVDRSTVTRWETGETQPQPWFRRRIAQALRISLDDLDGLLTHADLPETRELGLVGRQVVGASVITTPDSVVSASWSHRGTVEASVALSDGGGLVERREFLFLAGAALTAPAHQWLVHEPGPLASALSGARASAALADRLPAMVAELRMMDDVAGGGNVLSLARHQFGWVAGLLGRASYDESTGRRLHVALAEVGQLAGWVAYDAGHQALAQRYYLAALHAAHSADDRPLGAHILGCMAYQAARQGRPAEAVTLIDTAVAGARGEKTPSLLAELYSRQAYALAILQDGPACTAALSKARASVEQLGSGDERPWLYWVSRAEVTAGAGDSLLQLGQADQAAARLEEGIALFDEPFARDRQLYLTHLADALARPGQQRDLEAAASHGQAAIRLAKALTSTRSTGRIRDLHNRLKPHTQVAAVADFVERARDFLAA